MIVPLAQQLVAQGEKLLVFRNMRGPAQGCAKYLSKELGLGPATAVLDALPTRDLTGASQDLRECLAGGTAFHNTNLLRAEREVIEKGYRDPNGGIHVLAATTTLAASINTPASTVVLAENEFVGEDGRQFTVAKYKNMAGRAGRLGYNEIGKAIILAQTPIERAQLFQKFVLGVPEDAGGWEDGVRSCNPTNKFTKTTPSTPFPDDPRGSLGNWKAYLSGSYTLREIVAYFRVHYATVSRAARREWQLRTEPIPHGHGKTSPLSDCKT